MKRTATRTGLALTLAALLGGSSIALSTQELGGAQGLRPVPIPEGANDAEAGIEVQGFDEARWAERLLDDNLDAREQAFDNLARMARQNSDALAAIRRWTQNGGELAWTARLLEREVRRKPSLRLRSLPLSQLPGVHGHGQGLPDLQNRLRSIEELFGDWNQQFESIFEDLNGGLSTRRPGLFGQLGPLTGSSIDMSQGYSLQIEPGQVRLKITREENGVPEQEEYTAESVEALLEAHPELRDVIQERPGFGWQVRTQPRRGHDLDVPKTPLEVPTDILGIEYRKSEDGAETGLLVERVVPGTIAQVIGIQRGDRLLDLNGIALKSGEDISRILDERVSCDPIQVTLMDSRNAMKTLTWKPSDGHGH